ncbi:AAA domain-containing protein [Leptospira ognonensis]|nr:AAA domain-containing protein [Leptospira ognonensis]
MKIPFERLDEEIAAVTSALETERLLEREYYQNSKRNEKERIRGLQLEEEVYITGEIWRIHFTSHNPLSGCSFIKNGSPVLLESGEFSLVCQVFRSTDKTIILQYKGEIEIPDNDTFQVSPWFSESTYTIYFDAIEKISLKEEKRARNLLAWILGYHANEKPSVPKSSVDLSQLDRILNTQDYLFIFGPPGTGKTTLLVNAIAELRKAGKTILALTPTNFACDYLVESCVKSQITPVRLGVSAKIGPEIQEYMLESLIENSEEQKQVLEWRKDYKQLIKKAKSWKRNFDREDRDERKQLYVEAKALQKSIDTLSKTARMQILEKADVIISTFVPAWNFHKEGKRFDYVIIDEATQGIEPAFYLSLLLADKVICVGDPKQLPPTLNASDSILSETFLEKGISRDDGNRTLYLDKQYRMPEEILKFSNIEFYENRIKTEKKIAGHPTLLPPFEKNLVWIDTAGSDAEENYENDDLSCFNQMEIDLILSLFNEESSFANLAILSPYRKQIQLLTSSFRDKFPKVIPPIIQTIDSFQGREAETIILSFVRTNDTGEIGFLKDYRRLNVGLTRAKENLILVGNSVTLSEDKRYHRLLSLVKEIGEYRSIFEFLY